MKLVQIVLVVLLSAATAFAVGRYAPPAATSAPAKETAFERVMRTKTIRCAYVVRPPHIIVDANTKHLTGIDYDLMEAIGQAASLKIDWQDEVGYGSFPEQLSSGKQDVYCSLVLISARRASRVELTLPASYMPLHAYAREEVTTYDNNLSALNDKAITFAVIDGSSQKAATDSAFPNAKQFALPGDSDNSQTMLAVASSKADAVIADDNTVHDYNAHNPERKLRRIPNPRPIRTYAEAYAVGKGETELRDFLNAAIQEQIGNGVVEKIIAKYELEAGAILRTAQPFASAPQ